MLKIKEEEHTNTLDDYLNDLMNSNKSHYDLLVQCKCIYDNKSNANTSKPTITEQVSNLFKSPQKPLNNNDFKINRTYVLDTCITNLKSIENNIKHTYFDNSVA